MTGLLFLEHGCRSSVLSRRQDGGSAGPLPGRLPMRSSSSVCGALIAVGLFTRAAAFLASGTMAVAYFYQHAPQDFPREQHGRRTILYCFVFLYFVFAGPGPISIDAVKEAEQPQRVFDAAPSAPARSSPRPSRRRRGGRSDSDRFISLRTSSSPSTRTGMSSILLTAMIATSGRLMTGVEVMPPIGPRLTRW